MNDLLFPPSADVLLVRTATHHELARMIEPVHINGTVALLPFRTPLVRACIHETKFHQSQKAALLLGTVCRDSLISLPESEYILIPLPLSAARYRERGYNQATEIARHAVTELNHITIREDILYRKRNTAPQTTLTKVDREKNMKDAFAVKNPSTIQGKHLILLDDVITTGATIAAARAALLPHAPASVTCIAVAH